MGHPYDEDSRVRISNGDGETLFEGTTADLHEAGDHASRMKETAEDKGVRDGVNQATAAELRSFVERVERLEAEKAELSADVKEVYAEAKGRGYDTKVIRKVVSMRKRDPDDRAEEQAVLELYMSALGMS